MPTSSDSRVSVAVTFSGNGLITSFYSNAEDVMGFPSLHLTGRPIKSILSDRSALELAGMLDCVGERNSWSGEIGFRNGRGESIPGRGTLMQLKGASESPDGYLLVSMIHGPSRETEACLSVSDVAARLRAISHSMSNPLAVMTGFAQLVLLNEDCVGEIRADMEKLFSELDRVVEALDDLRSYAASLLERDPAASRGT